MTVGKIFIAATHQNVGKTMLSLGLLGNLFRRRCRIGYIKPVGQRTVAADGVQVDEDALLMERVFETKAILQDMNPVRVGRGFTAEFLQQGRTEALEHQILEAYGRISQERDFVVIEGTGHAGVGSVLNLSNARVAKLLGAPVVMVAPGGVGRPIDEVALNRVLLEKEGVELAGVVINKVQAAKYNQIRDLVTKGFARMGIPVLGVLPFDEALSAPTVREVMEEIGGDLLVPDLEEQALEAPVKSNLVGAMSAHQALTYFKAGSLVITPGDREDIILAAIGMAMSRENSRDEMVAGIVLTGQILPHLSILELIRRTRVPVMSCPWDTYTVASRIHDLMVKIRHTDNTKIKHATQLVGDNMNWESLLPAS